MSYWFFTAAASSNVVSLLASMWMFKTVFRLMLAKKDFHCCFCCKRQRQILEDQETHSLEVDTLPSRISEPHDVLSERHSLILRKQLFALASADMPFHFSFIFLNLLDLGPTQLFPVTALQTMCGFSYIIFRRSRFLSVLIELHIALSFVVLLARPSHHLETSLKLALYAIVLLAVTLALLDSSMNPGEWNPQERTCNLAHEDKTTILSLLATFGMTFVAYMVLMTKSCCVSGVRRKSLRMLAYYPLNFVISYSLILVLYLNPAAFWHRGNMVFGLSIIMESLSGFLNVWVYWSTAYQVRHALVWRGPTLDSLRASA